MLDQTNIIHRLNVTFNELDSSRQMLIDPQFFGHPNRKHEVRRAIKLMGKYEGILEIYLLTTQIDDAEQRKTYLKFLSRLDGVKYDLVGFI